MSPILRYVRYASDTRIPHVLDFSHLKKIKLIPIHDANGGDTSGTRDVGGDGVESFTGVGMLEGAELSLDEPELEEQMLEDLS
jgi:hypothetical protein